MVHYLWKPKSKHGLIEKEDQYLFKFNSEATIVLTYSDENNNTITLDDDDQLQGPTINEHVSLLRIYVKMKFNISDGSDLKLKNKCSLTSMLDINVIKKSSITIGNNSSLSS